MTVFVVFKVQHPDKMREAVNKLYPNDNFDLGTNEWLISAKDTALSVANTLGISTEPSDVGSAIVFSMSSYYGRTSSDVWEWIKTKTEATDG